MPWAGGGSNLDVVVEVPHDYVVGGHGVDEVVHFRLLTRGELGVDTHYGA